MSSSSSSSASAGSTSGGSSSEEESDGPEVGTEPSKRVRKEFPGQNNDEPEHSYRRYFDFAKGMQLASCRIGGSSACSNLIPTKKSSTKGLLTHLQVRFSNVVCDWILQIWHKLIYTEFDAAKKSEKERAEKKPIRPLKLSQEAHSSMKLPVFLLSID